MAKEDKKDLTRTELTAEPVEELTGVWEDHTRLGFSRLYFKTEEAASRFFQSIHPFITVIEAEYEVIGEKPVKFTKRETPDGNVVLEHLSCFDAEGNVFEHYDQVTIDKRVFEGNDHSPYHAIIPLERVQRRFPPVGDHRKLLRDRVSQVIESYETATTPKEKYKAESELCRLNDRLGGFLGEGIIYRRENTYLTSCERYGDYRIPHLRVAKTPQMPQTQQLTQDEALNHPLWKHYFGDESTEFADIIRRIKPGSFYFEGRARGVKNK